MNRHPRPLGLNATAVLSALLILSGHPLARSARAAQGEGTSDRTGAGWSSRSPYRSPTRTEKLLDAIALKLLLPLDYRVDDDLAARTAGIPGVQATRRFARTLPNGGRRIVELVSSAHPEGGFEIFLYGAEPGDGAAPNPDLPRIHRAIEQMLDEVRKRPAGTDAPTLAFHAYQLGYVQADRALALLKAVGYMTVEYTQQSGETVYDKIYTPIAGAERRFPLVVKLIDAPKTSLMDPPPPGATTQPTPAQLDRMGLRTESKTETDLAGAFLHQITAGEPQQRILIVYEQDDPESLDQLLGLIRDQIDQPARQIVIEALVIEVNSDRLRELGVSLTGADGRASISSLVTDNTGTVLPFTFLFDRNATQPKAFTATITALVQSGDAEVLSNPSVLVLDGRQARIQVGQRIPVAKALAAQGAVATSVEYFPIGILLNLRPRLSPDGQEVTMQVETIVSALNPNADNRLVSGTDVLFAPTVDSRQVQTFVRVANDTPFIIGGLISTDKSNRRSGVPVLSRIPLLGGLFRQTSSSSVKKEVIVVLTPHVVPVEDRSFSYLIPKESADFDSFGHRLFRNSYRLKTSDVFDLDFVYESPVLRELLGKAEEAARRDPSVRTAEHVARLLEGEVPGEEILVRRMLWDVVNRSGYGRHIDLERVIFFEDPEGTGGQVAFFRELMARRGQPGDALVLTFDAPGGVQPAQPSVRPRALVRNEPLSPERYLERLSTLNRRTPEGEPGTWAILLADRASGLRQSPIEVLRSVLVLKRVLDLNRAQPLHLRDFKPGRQILFPSEGDLRQRFHLIDRDTARLFYEVTLYYQVFEDTFNREAGALLDSLRPPGAPR